MKARERIGPFVVTKKEDVSGSGIFCSMCEKKLTDFDAKNDTHVPAPVELHASGAVPIPNFGWFCTQDCAAEYESKSDIRFARNEAGLIDYYEQDA